MPKALNMKYARLSMAVLSALLLGFAAVIGRRIRGGRARHAPTDAAPTGNPAPMAAAAKVQRHLAPRHLGTTLAVAIPLIAMSVLAWWRLEGSWRLVPAFLAGVLLVGLGF